MSVINKELKKKSSSSLKIQPSQQNLEKPNKVLKSKSQTGVCKSCQKRIELIRKLKNLCKEFDIINKPKDDALNGLIHNMYNKDLNWLEENIPLITYPLKSKPSCVWNNPCQDYPPWKLPRFPSRELVASRVLKNCECRKRNGLQDGCNRTFCKGSPHCLRKPYPVCIPSGMWKKMFTPEEYQKLMDYIDGVKRKRKPTEFCTCEPDPPKKEESTSCHSSCCTCHSNATSYHDSCSACVGSTYGNKSICSACERGEDCSSCSSQEEVDSGKLSSAAVDTCKIPSKSKEKLKNESLSGTDEHSCSECENKQPKVNDDSDKDKNKDEPIYYTDKDNNKKILTSILKKT